MYTQRGIPPVLIKFFGIQVPIVRFTERDLQVLPLLCAYGRSPRSLFPNVQALREPPRELLAGRLKPHRNIYSLPHPDVRRALLPFLPTPRGAREKQNYRFKGCSQRIQLTPTLLCKNAAHTYVGNFKGFIIEFYIPLLR